MKRPSMHSEEVAREAARTLLPKVRGWITRKGEACDDEDVVHDLAKALKYGHDGYEIAKDLESASWGPDSELVAILDGAFHAKYEAHQKMVAAWVKAHGIVATRKVGDKVRVTGNLPRKRGTDPVPGEIREIDAEHATYTVFCEALGHVRSGSGAHGVVLPFEQVLDAE